MDATTLARSIGKFSAKFTNNLKQSRNIVSSPLSAEYVLALIGLNAEGPSRDELLRALDFPDNDSIRLTFKSLTSLLKTVEGVTLEVANKVYIQKGPYDIRPNVKKDAEEIFDADVEQLDFNNADLAANMINSWVSDKTRNHINEIFSPSSFTAEDRVILVNAIYFKGTWKKKFDPSLTENGAFYINSNNTKMVPMMIKNDHFCIGYSEHLNTQLLELKYVGNDTSMMIVLPNEIEGLHIVLDKLADGYDLSADIQQMKNVEIRLSMPKFKIETTLNLKKILAKVGINSIFSDGSALNKLLTNNDKLFVSQALQKAYIEVNEEGAEAAAVTAMRIKKRKGPRFFEVDHPFLFILINNQVPFFSGIFSGEE